MSNRGTYGPNDTGYINALVREAAERLRKATEILSEGHYPHSNAKVIPTEHPLAVALASLAQVDRETAEFANTSHDPKLFAPHHPSPAAQSRWNTPEGIEGIIA